MSRNSFLIGTREWYYIHLAGGMNVVSDLDQLHAQHEHGSG